MQNLATDFDASVKKALKGTRLNEQHQALEHSRCMLENFFAKTKVSASVSIMDRDGNYPLIVITPHEEAKLDSLKSMLASKQITAKKFPGLGLGDCLSVIEKRGNQHWGIALNASFDLVSCIVKSLCGKGAAQDAAPALIA